MTNSNKTTLALLATLTLAACSQQPRGTITTHTGIGSSSDEVIFANKFFRDHWHPLERTTPSYITMPYRNTLSALKGQTAVFDKQQPIPAVKVATGSKKSLWDRIRNRLSLFNESNPRIEKYVADLKHDPYHINTLSERAQPFLHYIVEATENRGLPLELALLPMIESGFEPDAVSHARAAGLWQIMPTTGKYLGLTVNNWYDGRFAIPDSTNAALDYLEYLYDFFDGDWLLALAAYNAGEGRVQQAIKANRRRGKATDYWNLKLPRDTQIYVPKILALCKVIANPNAYGLDLEPIPDEPYLETVEIGAEVNLSLAAAMAGMTRAEIEFFNPGFTRGAISSETSRELLLPRDKALALQRKLAHLNQPTDRRRHHIVKRGDTLSHIALRYGITYRDLARWNGLNLSHVLKPGKKLIIRPPATINREKMLASTIEQ